MSKVESEILEALKELLETSAVITHREAAYKDDFVDLQCRVDKYEAAYDILKKYTTQKP